VGTRLILIEGMIGAGKSTTAERVAGRLSGRGEDARAFHEFAADHPIRTEAIDLLRAAYPEPVWSPDDVGDDGRARDPGVYAPEQWGRLAERCLSRPQTVILESSFLQNSVLPAFVDGAPADRLTYIVTTIEQQMAPAQPLLVYLRPTDTAAAIERVHRLRGEPWSSWNAASVAAFPWARTRGLRGRQAVIELYHAWESVVQELYDRYPFPKLMIDDPHDDWDAALERIHGTARP
jgi:predicted kinase